MSHDRVTIKGETLVLIPEQEYFDLLRAAKGEGKDGITAQMIREALVKYRVTAAAFARLAQTTPAQIARLLKGKQKPNSVTESNIRTAIAALEATSGDQKLSE